MKLFLASSADKTIHLLKEKVPDIGNNVLFIANAGDPYEDQWWIDWDRAKFKELGYNLNEIDLRETTPEEFEQQLQASDIVHMCGGSVYYIMGLIFEKKLEDVLTKAIKDENIIYTGTSAGSIIVSDSIKAFSYDSDETEYLKTVPNDNGLSLLNFSIVPHNNNQDSIPGHRKMVDEMPNDPTALFYIQDKQALWIEDKEITLLEVK